MKPIDRFTLDRIPASSDDEPLRARLLEGGVERAVVEGIWLEGQFTLSNGRVLLLTSYGTPWQGSVHLIVLSEAFVLLDHYVIWTFSGDSFVEGVALERGALSFSTHGRRFEVRARTSPGLALPPLGPNGLRRELPPWRPTHLAVRSRAETERRQEAEA